MKSVEQIKVTIISLVQNHYCDSELLGEDSAKIDGGSVLSRVISSLDTISLIVALEKLFDVEITDEELFSLGTIDELALIVFNKVDAVDK